MVIAAKLAAQRYAYAAFAIMGMSICLSVTLVYCVKMAESVIMKPFISKWATAKYLLIHVSNWQRAVYMWQNAQRGMRRVIKESVRWGKYGHHLANTIERSMLDGDVRCRYSCSNLLWLVTLSIYNAAAYNLV